MTNKEAVNVLNSWFFWQKMEGHEETEALRLAILAVQAMKKIKEACEVKGDPDGSFEDEIRDIVNDFLNDTDQEWEVAE